MEGDFVKRAIIKELDTIRTAASECRDQPPSQVRCIVGDSPLGLPLSSCYTAEYDLISPLP